MTSLDSTVFSATSYDVDYDCDNTIIIGYDCELKIPIGPFKVGTKFDSIYLYYSESKIVLDKNEELYEFKLKLSFEYTKTFQNDE
jgi:hypothetical protein